MSLHQNYKITSKEKNYFTMIPNVVTDMFSNGIINKTTFAFYVLCKRIAGDNGVCFKGRDTLKKELKCSTREIQKAKHELTMPRDFLNGKSLIILEKQEVGSQNADHIIIEDIWVENMMLYHEKTTRQKFPTLFPGEHPPVPIGTPPCSQGNTKKNTKEEPIKKIEEEVPAKAGQKNMFEKIIVFKHKSKNVITKEESKIYDYLREKGYFDSEIQIALQNANEADPVLRAENHFAIERYLSALIDKTREKIIRERKYNEHKCNERTNNYQQDSIQRSRESFTEQINALGPEGRQQGVWSFDRGHSGI